MTKQDKLTKLIEIAVENSAWNPKIIELPRSLSPRQVSEDILHNMNTLSVILFNHDFAKAIWGEDEVPDHYDMFDEPSWKKHIKQAVISDDPLEYYWKNRL